MAILATLHRWAGATIGMVLVVLGLTGALLVWEGDWIGVTGANDPVVSDPAVLIEAVETARAHHPGLSRVTFANEEIGLHQAAYADGGGVYIDRRGAIVASWNDQWDRPELWLFDLHHHLFAGEAGEIVTGIAGLTGLFFVVSGVILWWRTRRLFVLRLWPRRLTRSSIVRQHRDLGIVVAPLLIVSFLTGAAMIFAPVSDAITAAWPARSEGSVLSDSRVAQDDLPVLFARSTAIYPGAEIRRIQFSPEAEFPTVLRLRQASEWTPNGRSYVRLRREGRISIEGPGPMVDRMTISEKFYPIHAAKVGGRTWQVLMTLSGLALAILGTFAIFGFWRSRTVS